MNGKFVGIIEISLAVISFGLAVCTISPNSATPISNFFGYHSTCPMAPVSTLICLSVSVVCFYLFKVKRRAYKKYINQQRNNNTPK